MGKIDEKIMILPDIEMYGGNNEDWIVRLYKQNGTRYGYAELANKNCSFSLIIKDYGYIHRSNGTTNFSVTKNGRLDIDDDDGHSAVAKFSLDTGDTMNAYGKFTYQVDMTCSGTHQSAQGNLFIIKNINQ